MLQTLLGLAVDLTPGHEAELVDGHHARQHVFGHRQRVHHVDALRHVGHAGAERLAWVHRGEGVAVDGDRAHVDRLDAHEDGHQGRLAGAILADQSVDFAGHHRQVYVFQGLHAGKGFANALHL